MDDKTMRIWNLEYGEEEATPMDKVRDFAVTRDGNQILTMTEDKGITGIQVFDAKLRQLVQKWNGKRQHSMVAISRGYLIAVCLKDVDFCTIKGHTQDYIATTEYFGDVMCLAFVSDGSRLARGARDSAGFKIFTTVYDVKRCAFILRFKAYNSFGGVVR
jgi:WD40 repeat protein